MQKNSFTLFETLISVVLLSFVIVGFSQNSYYENFDKQFQVLNDLENSFSTNTYNTSFTNSSENLIIIKNDTLEESVLVNKISFQDEDINLIKYKIK